MKYLKTIYLLLCCTLALAACSDDVCDPFAIENYITMKTPHQEL